ncbi:MAG TPA: alpha/beta fold hydrolase [Stellaceae bacterium]|jgi:homoserine O-acetyltransferase|nr:alpha/beta fold hydrolase [Stellaceae bacterium]
MPETYADRWPNFTEGDFILKDYVFASGETLPELKLHYRTMGVPRRDSRGKIVNGVLLLQGNTGTGENWLRPSLADHLYGPGQPLDARKYFLIMQDALGRGGSSKPSDGLRGAFPHYRYRDMVDSGYRLITEHLGIGHLRLVIGSSMGGMHCWLWAEAYPDLMDGVVALSCQPVEISGRNWLGRKGQAEAIRNDPDWKGGFYDRKPRHYIYAAAGNFGTESPTRIQEMAPTLAAASALYEKRLAEAAKGDANNQLWAIEAIQDYNPEPDLDKIKAKLVLVNDAEDHANPPELGTVERAMQRVKDGRYVLLPAGPNTHGHFSHFYAELWKPYLIELLAELGPEQAAAAAE